MLTKLKLELIIKELIISILKYPIAISIHQHAYIKIHSIYTMETVSVKY